MKPHTLARTGNAAVMSPDRFHGDMVKLAHNSPTAAAEVAGEWRNRFLNAAEATQAGATKIIEVVTAAVLTFGMGLFDGRQNAVKKSMLINWDREGRDAALAKMIDAKLDVKEDDARLKSPFARGLKKEFGAKMDPTSLFGVPITLAATFIVGTLAVFNVGAKLGINNFIQAGALGAVSYWSGMAGYDVAYQYRFEKDQPNTTVTYVLDETTDDI